MAVATDDPQAIGKRVYREGILASGRPLKAKTIGDVTMEGKEAACFNCHRRSGLGGSEGGELVLSITGSSLFKPGPVIPPNAHGIKPFGKDMARPAYDLTSLAVALRQGKAPNGRAFSSAMPRFELDDIDVAALAEHLKSLNQNSQGVNANQVRWATVVTPDADPQLRQAQLAVIKAYLDEHNRNVLRYQQHGHIPPDRGFAPLKSWELAVWELKGDRASWGAQLDSLQAAAPVFAVIGGVSGGSWQPIHDFCERTETACLFPDTPLPAVQEADFHTLYFSRGLVGEAEALAQVLVPGNSSATGKIVQIYRTDTAGQDAAQALRAALQTQSRKSNLIDKAIPAQDRLTSQSWRSLLKAEHPTTLILWLVRQDLRELPIKELATIDCYYSGQLLRGTTPPLASDKTHGSFVVSAYAPPELQHERLSMMSQWLESQQIERSDDIAQGNAYWTLWMLDKAMERIANHYSADFLIEQFEDTTDNLGGSSVFPRLTLAPGQRFAAKSTILYRADANGRFTQVAKYP